MAILHGTNGADTLTGGDGDDWLLGFGGDDYLDGGKGADVLLGGKGNDHLDGGEGADALNGGDDDDKLYGREGNDGLIGGKGNDKLYGNAGNDGLWGGQGNDHLYGRKGDDTLKGDSGNDYLEGGAGDDRLEGGTGNDKLYGNADDDYLWGGAGDDTLEGGDGDDTLVAGHRDLKFRSQGADPFDDGKNTLRGGDGDDRLHGGEKDDKLYGGDDNDRLHGNQGNDYLEGGEGNDGLHGRSGDDTLYGESGNDWLTGGDDDDTLEGGTGYDTLTGGAGADVFRFKPGHSPPNLYFHGDVITDFQVAGANRDALDLSNFNIDLTRDLESQGLTLSGVIDADGDGSKDDRKITLPDGGIIALLNLGSAALAIDDFTFAIWTWTEDGSHLIIVDPGAEGQPDPEPEGQPDPEPAESILQQQLDLANTPIFADDGSVRPVGLKVLTSEAQSGRLAAGDLDIGGGAQQKASDDGAHRSSYHLYYDAEGGSYYLRFDDARTADLPISATAAQVDAALEGLAGVTSAEVTGEPGDLTIALTAEEPHILQWSDLNLDGDGGLDYLIA